MWALHPTYVVEDLSVSVVGPILHKQFACFMVLVRNYRQERIDEVGVGPQVGDDRRFQELLQTSLEVALSDLGGSLWQVGVREGGNAPAFLLVQDDPLGLKQLLDRRRLAVILTGRQHGVKFLRQGHSLADQSIRYVLLELLGSFHADHLVVQRHSYSSADLFTFLRTAWPEH